MTTATTGTLSAEARRRCCGRCGKNVAPPRRLYVHALVQRCRRCHAITLARWKASYRAGRQRLAAEQRQWFEQQRKAAS